MLVIINHKLFKMYDLNYYVSQDGDVYSTFSNKLLKWNYDKDGYPRVDIHGKHMKIHKLVYLTWVCRNIKNKQINHLDDNKNNPSLNNLYLGTQKENMVDRTINGHCVGNTKYMTIFDKEIGQVITFSPISDFIEYSGHPAKNGSVKRMFNKNWFKKRYIIIEYNNTGSVTTTGDECSPVAQRITTERSASQYAAKYAEEIV